MPDSLSASEYFPKSVDAAFLPTIPTKCGPTLCFVASALWQALHFVNNVFPLSASAAKELLIKNIEVIKENIKYLNYIISLD